METNPNLVEILLAQIKLMKFQTKSQLLMQHPTSRSIVKDLY